MLKWLTAIQRDCYYMLKNGKAIIKFSHYHMIVSKTIDNSFSLKKPHNQNGSSVHALDQGHNSLFPYGLIFHI